MSAVVTVVIPAWGTHVGYVPAAVDSLIAQDGPEIDIVVVDNRSDVPVPELPASVRIVTTRARLPVGAARNVGLREAASPYVMFWDADDLMTPGTLRRMHDVLATHPHVVAVTTDSVRWHPDTGAGDRWPWPRSVMYRLSRRPPLLALVAQVYNPFTTTGPALMRTDAVRDAGGFAEDVEYFEDWALAASLTVRGRIAMLRDIGRLYRIHDASLTLGHLGHPDQGAWLAAMRRRNRRDPRVPVWLKALQPLVLAHHVRRTRRGRRADSNIGFYESVLDEVGGTAAS